ncbi:MAG: DPP IV N-terminal domain-containing protein, partial [Pyrinomonadaceae bacterium]
MNSLRLFALTFFLLLLNVVPASAQGKQLTLDDIYDPVKRLKLLGAGAPELRWLKDGEHYLESREDARTKLVQPYKVNAATGAGAPLFDAARMESALVAGAGVQGEEAKRLAHLAAYRLNPAENALLINHGGDLLYYDLGNQSAKRLTATPAIESDEEFSPDGRTVSFVRGNNLYVIELATHRERALTTDGGERLLNARLDWIYEEELYGRGNTKGYWWSPDGASIAYLQLNEASVRNFAVVDHIPQRQIVEDTPYPLPGDPNPTVKLGIVGVAGDAAQTRWVDTAKYEPVDLLIVRVSWTPDSRRVVYQAQNREQTYLDLNYADRADSRSATMFRETSPAWVEVIDNPEWLSDGSFIWRSERTGWMHLYHYSANGQLIRQITDGKWEARSIARVDEAQKRIYFNGTQHSHIAENLYRVGFDGTNLSRITQAAGGHRILMSPKANYFIDSASDAKTPVRIQLHRADNSPVRTILENRAEELKDYGLGAVDFLQVKTRDGFPMEAMMIKPPDFDPHKKYPVWSYTYAGPHAPSVRNAWGGAT